MSSEGDRRKPTSAKGQPDGREKAKVSSNWLIAAYDPAAGLATLPSCLCFADLFGDGDWKLLVGHIGFVDSKSEPDKPGVYGQNQAVPKLKVYKGPTIIQEQTLIDVPTGTASFYMDSGDRRTPAIAVAAGSFLFIYKNMKPFYKFSLPSNTVLDPEKEAWQSAREGVATAEDLHTALYSIRMEHGLGNMTPRSQAYLSLGVDPVSSAAADSSENPELDLQNLREAFIKFYRNEPLKRPTVITSIITMSKNAAGLGRGSVSEGMGGGGSKSGSISGPNGAGGGMGALAAMIDSTPSKVDCLVLGTEAGSIVVLEPDAFTVLATVSLPAIPVHITASGHFDVDYRLVVACRDCNLYSVKRGFATGRLVVGLNSQPVGLLRLGTNVVVATMDSTLSCYTTKGNCLWTIKEQGAITSIEMVEVPLLAMKLIAVATSQKIVNLYHDRVKVDSLSFPEVVTSIRCGPFGREGNALVMITGSGTLIVQIMRRLVNFKPLVPGQDDSVQSANQSADPAAVPLVIPKKSNLFVEQTMREREQYINIHRTFQHDLYRMKLISARAYAKAIEARLAPVTGSSDSTSTGGDFKNRPTDQVKVSAQVHGLGPVFRLGLQLRNMSGSETDWCYGLTLTFSYDTRIYRLNRNIIHIPNLIPGYSYPVSVRVENISPLNVADTVKVYVVKRPNTIPLVSAIVNFPACEAQF